MKEKSWYKEKLDELKDNREFLREYIAVLEAEIDVYQNLLHKKNVKLRKIVDLSHTIHFEDEWDD